MLLHSIHSEKLATLATQVRLADESTPELLSDIVAKTTQRMYPPGAAQLDQLIEAGALTEAAFALGQRFLGSNHIRRPPRVCRTMCG
jgi:hypothetical protein